MPRKNPKAYYHYGEGGVMHPPQEACPEGYGQNHPEVHRTEYPHRWAYYRAWLAMRWYHWELGHWIVFPRDGSSKVAGNKHRRISKLMHKLAGRPSWDYPYVRIPMRNEDSIYDRL